MITKAMWFHHLSLVWNVVSTIFVVAFVIVWIWYGLKLEIGKKDDAFYFLYQTNPFREQVRDIKDTFFSNDSPWAIYNRKADQIVEESRLRRAQGTLTETYAEESKKRLNQLWEDYKKSDQYRTGKVYKSDTTSHSKAK